MRSLWEYSSFLGKTGHSFLQTPELSNPLGPFEYLVVPFREGIRLLLSLLHRGRLNLQSFTAGPCQLNEWSSLLIQIICLAKGSCFRCRCPCLVQSQVVEREYLIKSFCRLVDGLT